MNYYYDVVLNFLENSYLFYEWDELDNIEYIKKIPLFQVDSQTFHDFFEFKVKVDSEFLEEIENKTIKKNGKLKYACLLADKNNAYAYEFDESGFVITRSSLVLNDELSLIDYIYTVQTREIKYEKFEKLKSNKETRISSKIKKFINLEIEKLYQEKNEDKLKFLYLEWFNKKENNIDKIYKEMVNKLKKEISEEEISIYNIIKLSYNNV